MVYLVRSLAFSNIGMYEKALEDAETAIKLDPREAKGYVNKAYALLGVG